MADASEYIIPMFMVTFTLVMLFMLSIMGYSKTQYQTYDQEISDGFNVITGLKLFYSNPIDSGIEKFMYSLLIIAPFSVFITLLSINITRGR